MLKLLLGNYIYGELLKGYNVSHIYEVRIRIKKPIVINYRGINIYLKDTNGKIIIASKSDIERVIMVASNHSLYTVENQLKQAFITAEMGYRIGVAGEMVCNSVDGYKSIKNIHSVNIRVPHFIKNCSEKIYKYIKNEYSVKSTLIISPPGAGKTTLLRDLCLQMSNGLKPINILLVDERYEIAAVKDGVACIDVGICTDIISGSSKTFAFENGIRSLKPDVIVVDELAGQDDVVGVKNAISSGVSVVASIHSSSIENLWKKTDSKILLESKLFDRYILLSDSRDPGKIAGIFDEDYKCIYY